MALKKMEENLERIKQAGRELVGQDLPPLHTQRKKKHIPEPGKTWTGYLRRLERARGEKDK
jgi:2-iminoacetate synthase ThiH